MGTITPDKTVIVTTSWDDGHPLDIRLAELLESYGMKGTFYIPVKYDNHPMVSEDGVHVLKEMGMEIGSHTLTHAILTQFTMAEMLYEMRESKNILEDICEEAITSICYPEGRFNDTVCSASEEAGYRIGRTTLAFNTEIGFNAFCMPVSFQFFPHSRGVHIRHAMKEGNLKGLTNWIRLWKIQSNLLTLAGDIFDYVLTHGGILHIWGHSWEIEQFGLWEQLEEVLRQLSHRQGVLYLTNSEILAVRV